MSGSRCRANLTYDFRFINRNDLYLKIFQGKIFMNKYFAKGVANLALIFGAGSLVLFTVFLYRGSFSFFKFGLSEAKLLLMDAGLSLIFFIQHSTMLRKSFRQYAQTRIPPHYYGAFYAITSGIALFVLLIFWQKSSILFMSAEGVYRWLFRILFLISIMGFIWANRSLSAFDPFGVKNIIYRLKNKEPKTMPLAIRGPYKLVRHPLYSLSLLMIWSCPDISADRLLFNLLWTIWIIIGTLLEEKDLVCEFGEDYRKYQKTTPMLIPFGIFNKQP